MAELRYASSNGLCDYRCPMCRLLLLRKPVGLEIECPSCHNTFIAYDHGGGDFVFEVWTGRLGVDGKKEWVVEMPGKKARARVL